ncbi:MAG: metal ABC transporter permease [Phycisphaerae bacterium]
MIDVGYFAPVLATGLLAGASTGVLGVYIVGMRIPFLGVCVAHAALAGAVFGTLAGLEGTGLLAAALVGSAATALVLGLADPHRIKADTNVVMGMLFSLTMGLAFLGIGLFSVYGISDSDVRGLLWGSLAFCSWDDVAWMAGVTAAEVLFIGFLYKEMRAIMFSREHAAAAGVRVTLVWSGFLLLTSAVLTINFQAIGGLMIYSLLANPAAAAFQLVRGHGRSLVAAGGLGALSGVGGFVVAALLDLPVGATIVIFSSLLVLVAAVLARLGSSAQTRPG